MFKVTWIIKCHSLPMETKNFSSLGLLGELDLFMK